MANVTTSVAPSVGGLNVSSGSSEEFDYDLLTNYEIYLRDFSFDEFFRISAGLGGVSIVLTLISLLFAHFTVKWRLRLIPAWVARTWPSLSLRTAKGCGLAIQILLFGLPILVTLIWSLVVAFTMKPAIIGLSVMLGMFGSALLIASAGTWWAHAWRLTKSTTLGFALIGVALLAWEIVAMVTGKHSYIAFSSTFLNYNAVCVTFVVYLNTFDDRLRWSAFFYNNKLQPDKKPKVFPFTRAEHIVERQENKRATLILYAVGLAFLVGYVVLCASLLESEGVPGVKDGDEGRFIGLNAALVMLLVDILIAYVVVTNAAPPFFIAIMVSVSRGCVTFWGPRFWLLGHATLFVVFGTAIGLFSVDRSFPRKNFKVIAHKDLQRSKRAAREAEKADAAAVAAASDDGKTDSKKKSKSTSAPPFAFGGGISLAGGDDDAAGSDAGSAASSAGDSASGSDGFADADNTAFGFGGGNGGGGDDDGFADADFVDADEVSSASEGAEPIVINAEMLEKSLDGTDGRNPVRRCLDVTIFRSPWVLFVIACLAYGIELLVVKQFDLAVSTATTPSGVEYSQTVLASSSSILVFIIPLAFLAYRLFQNNGNRVDKWVLLVAAAAWAVAIIAGVYFYVRLDQRILLMSAIFLPPLMILFPLAIVMWRANDYTVWRTEPLASNHVDIVKDQTLIKTKKKAADSASMTTEESMTGSDDFAAAKIEIPGVGAFEAKVFQKQYAGFAWPIFATFFFTGLCVGAYVAGIMLFSEVYWYGLAVGYGLTVPVMTWMAVELYFETSRRLSFAFVALLLCAWLETIGASMAVWHVEYDFDGSVQGLGLISTAFLYPAGVSLFFAYKYNQIIRWKKDLEGQDLFTPRPPHVDPCEHLDEPSNLGAADEPDLQTGKEYKQLVNDVRTRSDFWYLFVAMFLLLVFIVLTLIFFDNKLAGIVLGGCYLLGCYGLYILYVYFAYDRYIPMAHRLTAVFLVVVVVMVGVVVGLNDEVFLGFSISVGAMFVATAGYAVLTSPTAQRKVPLYSQYVFPAYLFDPRNQILTDYNFPPLMGFTAIILVISYGLVLSAFKAPIWGGLSVSAIAQNFLAIYFLELTIGRTLKLGRAMVNTDARDMDPQGEVAYYKELARHPEANDATFVTDLRKPLDELIASVRIAPETATELADSFKQEERIDKMFKAKTHMFAIFQYLALKTAAHLERQQLAKIKLMLMIVKETYVTDQDVRALSPETRAELLAAYEKFQEKQDEEAERLAREEERGEEAREKGVSGKGKGKGKGKDKKKSKSKKKAKASSDSGSNSASLSSRSGSDVDRNDPVAYNAADVSDVEVWDAPSDISAISSDSAWEAMDQTERDMRKYCKTRARAKAKFEATGAKWVDAEFPPVDKSVFLFKGSAVYKKDKEKRFKKYKKGVKKAKKKSKAKRKKKIAKEVKKYQDKKYDRLGGWKRPEEFYAADELKLMNEDWRGRDIKQGALGDCWFVSAIAVLGKRSDLVYSVFVEPHINPYGVYGVRFWKDGEVRIVVVDDLFPANVGGKPMMGRPVTDGEIWPLLVEKAYAKLHTCYEALQSGRVANGLADLTGGIPIQYDNDRLQTKSMVHSGALFRALLDYHRKGYLMGAGSPGGGGATDEDVSPLGIHFKHQYSVLQVVELPEVDSGGGGRIQLVQVRNPHGMSEWKGAWGDNWSKWTQKRKELLKFEDKNDGVFWMEFSDFVENFKSIYVCKLANKVAHEREAIWISPAAAEAGVMNTEDQILLDAVTEDVLKEAKGSTYHTMLKWQVKVTRPTEVTVVLSQSDPRRMAGLSKDERKKRRLHLRCDIWKYKKGGKRFGQAQAFELIQLSGLLSAGKRETSFIHDLSVACEAVLTPGTYAIVCRAAHKAELFHPSRMFLKLYSKHKVEMLPPQQDLPSEEVAAPVAASSSSSTTSSSSSSGSDAPPAAEEPSAAASSSSDAPAPSEDPAPATSEASASASSSSSSSGNEQQETLSGAGVYFDDAVVARAGRASAYGASASDASSSTLIIGGSSASSGSSGDSLITVGGVEMTAADFAAHAEIVDVIDW